VSSGLRAHLPVVLCSFRVGLSLGRVGLWGLILSSRLSSHTHNTRTIAQLLYSTLSYHSESCNKHACSDRCCGKCQSCPTPHLPSTYEPTRRGHQPDRCCLGCPCRYVPCNPCTCRSLFGLARWRQMQEEICLPITAALPSLPPAAFALIRGPNRTLVAVTQHTADIAADPSRLAKNCMVSRSLLT
jgi:hypothetical protein